MVAASWRGGRSSGYKRDTPDGVINLGMHDVCPALGLFSLGSPRVVPLSSQVRCEILLPGDDTRARGLSSPPHVNPCVHALDNLIVVRTISDVEMALQEEHFNYQLKFAIITCSSIE